jgi:hypothetical protein
MNVVSLDGGKTPDKLAEALRDFKRNYEVFQEYHVMLAGIHRSKFLALKLAGFNDEQALELCKNL